MKRIQGFLLIAGITICTSHMVHAQDNRKSVKTDTASIILHPEPIAILNGSDSIYFFVGKDVLYMSDRKGVYADVSGWLPIVQWPGRSVLMQGILIEPFSMFSKEQLNALKDEVQKKLGGKLNDYKIARINGMQKRGAEISPDLVNAVIGLLKAGGWTVSPPGTAPVQNSQPPATNQKVPIGPGGILGN